MDKKNRRTFLQVSAAAILSVLGFSWIRLTKNQLKIQRQKDAVIPFNPNKAVDFPGSYIVVNRNGATAVFRSKCTHLGCTINSVEHNRLLCPCHGSEYDLDGKVLKGPAYKNLEEVDFKFSEDKTRIEIVLYGR